MGWKLVDYDAVGTSELDAWLRTRNGDPALDNPFFHPAFAAAVHAVCGDVQVIVDDHEDHVWFPVQVRRGLARPVGSPGADFQGPVVAPGARIDPVNMLHETGLRVLKFDHLSERRSEFEPWIDASFQSPFIDATDGLDGYLTRVSKAGRDKISRVRRMTNKAARQLGEVRLVFDEQDPALLDRLIEIKRAQYRATGVFDFFASPRRQALVHHLAKTKVQDFAGVLSAVYAGETLLAAHLGLRDRGVLHWWFPVYSRSHSELAPGWILLRELIAAAPSNGLTRIDLGRGEEDYKTRAMTGSVSVYEGEVGGDMLRRQLRHAQRDAVRRLKSSPLGPRLRSARNRARALRDAFH